MKIYKEKKNLVIDGETNVTFTKDSPSLYIAKDVKNICIKHFNFAVSEIHFVKKLRRLLT